MSRKGFWFGLVIVLLMLCGLPAEASTLVEEKDEYIIVIDPGHGGDNWGTTSNENFKEKEITMKTARALVEELSKYDGVQVYMTHEKDVDMSLAQRAAYAAKMDADYLFSIHYNASETHTMFGTEVWIPLDAPYHAPCYQFAYLQQLQMQELGLFSRGIKTRINDEGTDYYGVIRESVMREVPAVIIEHCYVDEERDADYCDEDTDYAEFGRRDAIAIAQFLGLESYELPVEVESLQIEDKVADTYMDASVPDVCEIKAQMYDKENGLMTIMVNASDAETSVMYYDYTLDGGKTFSKLHPWPGSDLLTGDYDEHFALLVEYQEGEEAQIYVRAYNKFDLYQVSNVLSNFANVPSSEEMSVVEPEADGSSDVAEELKEYVPVAYEEPAEDNTLRMVVLCLFIFVWTILLILMGYVIYRFFFKKR